MTEFIFSYGTLQDKNVQQAVFGTTLSGKPDAVTGFRLTQIEIGNDEVVRVSGQTHHPILVPSGEDTDAIPGMVFEVTPAGLQQADDYEGTNYKRVAVDLLSGGKAWMYVAANF